MLGKNILDPIASHRVHGSVVPESWQSNIVVDATKIKVVKNVVLGRRDEV